MTHPDSSQRPDGKSNPEHHDSRKVDCNLSGLKHALHGTSYQLKLGIVVSLANAKKSLDSDNAFSFAVSAEDPTAGKFDDIVYSFKDGEKTGILKIQVKHKLGSPVPPITLKDFTTTSDTKNPFAILKYFASFCDQQQSTTDLEGFVICTNADINDKSKDIWKTVKPSATNDSAPSLDTYVSTLFDSVGAKYYQLDHEILCAAGGTFNNIYQLLRKCSKLARLAKLLVEATKSNKKITYNNSLFKEYRKAILLVIDRNEASKDDSYGFTKEFLLLPSSTSIPGYETFRKEFEDQYRQIFKINGCVWDDLKLKRVHVSNDYLSDENDQYSSLDSFPNDNVDESLRSFCERLRLVCGTLGEHELDDAITKIWRNMQYDDNQLVPDRLKGYNEENIATERLFKSNFDWLMDPFAKPLRSEDIKKDFENIRGTLAHMKLESISDKLRENVLGSSFRVSAKALRNSELHELVENENVVQIGSFNIKFGATVLLDILKLQSKDHSTTLFLNDSDFITNSDSVEAVLRCDEPPICLVIICHKAFKKVESIVGKWVKNILKKTEKQVVLIRKIDNFPSDLACFRLCDLAEESWVQFRSENITLGGTTISPFNIFENNFRELPIEQVIKLLDWGRQMEENNEILKKYGEIESTYVHRPWVDEECKLKAESIRWNKDTDLYKSIKEPKQEGMSLNEIMKSLKRSPYFNELFAMTNNPEEEHQPIVGDQGKKVLILLGEAGHGKSTSLTWFSWYLRNRNPSSWVVRCNLSDHCSDFKPFIQNQDNETAKVIDETEALRMLYKMYRSSLQLEREMAGKCSKYLVYSDGEANVSVDLMKNHGLSLNFSILLLVFREKFNAGELVILLDGFDEIAPNYKEVVLKLLSHFEQFKGVGKIYLTSRPYGFKMQFDKTCKDPLFFQLKPLSLEHKCCILFKMMKVKWYNWNIDDGEITDFYKSLCYMLLRSLGSMSDVPLNLMMAVDITGDSVYNNEIIKIDFSSETFKIKLFETIFKLSKASFIIEEFVKVKIRHLLYDKNGVDKNVADKPAVMERFEKAIDEVKLVHGLQAVWSLFDEREMLIFFSPDEINEVEEAMNEVRDGKEKTGIIHYTQDAGWKFIHRTFAEYLAAWWIVKRQMERNQQDRKKLSCLESFWGEEHKELRANIDTILAKRHPLHAAIIERDWEVVESLLSTNPNSLYVNDDGKRTALHLLAFYYDFEENWPHFLPDSMKSYLINAKEKIFGWTALDYAFRSDKPQLIFYLLHHGASINVNFIYEQVASVGKDKIRKAAKYARYVMGYLSHHAIDYQSHDACIKMKQFCDNVVAGLVNDASANTEQKFNRDLNKNDNSKAKKTRILEDIIAEDSVWMLESVIQTGAGRKHFVRMIRNSYFDLELGRESMMLLKCFRTNDAFILNDNNLWHCIILSVAKNYKDEFQYFFDLYCSRIKIKNFQTCSIQSYSIDCSIESDVAGDLINYVENNAKRLVGDFMNNICWAKLGIPPGIMIDENILSLLAICVATVRTSMLRYLKESCKLNLSAGIVYSLAMITNHLHSKLRLEVTRHQETKAYECLLDLASNISDVEANKMLRLAITSNLFEFSKCLIERYNIDFQAVDELKGWNVFHLCASNHWSFLVEEITSGDNGSCYIDGYKTDLFHYMQAKASDMDCFDISDKKGRSIFHLAIENDQRGLVEHILARKLGLNYLKEIRNLSIDAVPNIAFCYHAIREISKSVGEKKLHYEALCFLARQIAKISLTNREESQEQNSGRLLLQENAKELHQMAMKSRCLFLMYFLHREFPSMAPPMIYDSGWLACAAKSMRSPEFLDVTKWLFNPNQVDQHVNFYEIVGECDDESYDHNSVNLEKIVEQVDENLSANRSLEEVCKLKLLAFAVCLKQESMIRHLFEDLNVNIDWKVLIDIMLIAHQLIDEAENGDYKGCSFEKPDFIPIYRFLFERTSNLGETDAEGGNILHLATQSGLGCMAKFLIKHNMVNVLTTNEQNGWNIFHYFSTNTASCSCCFTDNDELLYWIIKRVLEITSDAITIGAMTEFRKKKMRELCFDSNEGRKSVIHVAVASGNVREAEYFTCWCLGIYPIEKHKIRNAEECSGIREDYDVLSQIASQLPFNGNYDYLLHRLAKMIQRFSQDTIEHITEQANVEDHIVEDACRTAINSRSVLTLEHLMVACEDQMNRALVRSTKNELIVCMMECIRRNRINIFKVLVGHYRTSQGIQPKVEVDYEEEQNESEDDTKIDEYRIQWSAIKQFSQDVTMNRDYLPLLILSIAYGRLSMIRFLVEMLQLEANKSLILLIMKVLDELWDRNYKAATPVYEYLASRCEGKPNLLHLCIQAECYAMLEYLIKEKNLDPNEVDSENGWNVGHHYVSDPHRTSGYKEFIWLVEAYDLDCFGVYDRNGRSILHLAIENGRDRVVKYILRHRLGLKGDNQTWYEWDLEKIEKHINELQQILKSIADKTSQQTQQVLEDILEKVTDRKIALTTYKQLYANQS